LGIGLLVGSQGSGRGTFVSGRSAIETLGSLAGSQPRVSHLCPNCGSLRQTPLRTPVEDEGGQSGTLSQRA